MKCSYTKYNGLSAPWEWRNLGVADPGSGEPWEWRTVTLVHWQRFWAVHFTRDRLQRPRFSSVIYSIICNASHPFKIFVIGLAGMYACCKGLNKN